VARKTLGLAQAIGRRLTQARRARRLSIRKLAQLALLDKETVLEIGLGRVPNPGIGTIADLARALQVSAAWPGFGVGGDP